MMTRRTVARGALLTTGVVTALVLAGCGGGQNTASGGATPSVAAGTTGSSLGSGDTFIPVTSTTPPAPAVATTTTDDHGGGGGGGTSAGGECRTTSLKLSLGPSDGAAGHVFQALRFTNVSKVSCEIVGFPGVSYVTGTSGAQVGQPAQRDGAIGAQITLKPGQVASTVLTLTDVGVFDASACKPTATRGLRVYPPDSTASMFIAQTGTGCAGTTPSAQLRVQTIKPGAGSA
jgi:hypothetical protein